MAFTMNLAGPSPWGFRISGGRDFKKAITVSKVNPGSKAEKASLQPGDVIMEINGENTGDMLNVEAQNKIKNSTTRLQLLVERPAPSSPGQTNGISSTEQLVGRFKETLHVRDENQNYREYSISSPKSFSPGPYSPEPPSSPERKGDRIMPTTKSPVFHSWTPEEKITSNRLSRPLSQEFSPADFRSNSASSRTPTPPERYSPHSPMEREIPVSPRRNSSDFAMQRFDRESEVYKMIQENKESRAAPRQSNTFKMLQEVLEADEKEAALRFPGKLSPNPPKPVSPVAGVQKYHICEKCGNNIVTQAVRIVDERFRHPECYTCTDCGLNLKMRGHFWVENELFCEKHARERYQGPGAGYRYHVSPQH
ncbi:PDZ and LIM domain protein 2 [Ictalurus punctatus]|uniref:PDZ and LIM domain protein 2 n=1 Tax=Ictalurus punctatus TaxID=7998 RepID=W5UEX6_ICTPU|nr:PDZ and LIM domain protein 2 [Ictalurus punctatus]XP_017323939.1 PDZ and LIM domain protein 2 [Ictalurus punctatus]XP_017323940.1 PDZ and LIM domain protein 2 [Ictalurus punctatus]XP_053536105.1 PDZ and LIM domain protein 2 [Ictalurus punctatus]